MSDDDKVSDTTLIIVLAILCATVLVGLWIVFR